MDLLYKYRPFDSQHPKECERTLKMLRERTAWMATPSSFNDPFDCQPSILRNDETEQRDLATIVTNRLRLINHALRTGAQLADKECRPIPRRKLVELKRMLKSRRSDDHKYQELTAHFVEPPDGSAAFCVLQASLSRVGVMSLSANPTQMLMWAHYASQHCGFCLGFERSEESLLKDDVHTKSVNYGDVYPELDLSTLEVSWSVSVGDGAVSDSLEIDIHEPHLRAVIYSKSKDWECEQEWRVLVPEGGKLSPYPGPLRKLIFGLRCGQESRLQIRAAAMEAAEAPIQFAEIESATGSFALRIRDLDLDLRSPVAKN